MKDIKILINDPNKYKELKNQSKIENNEKIQ